MTTGTGLHLRRALQRAAAHERFGLSSGRPLKISIGLSLHGAARYDGLMIIATTPPRTPAEERLLTERGWRVIPWAELDARAASAARLVDEAVADLEHLFGERARA